MAARKGQGTTQRGKQRARKRPVPELSPPQSSSDEESWPIWQKLQQRMDALGGARAGQAPAAQGGRQPRRSTRDARGHRRAKLRALAQDIHNKLAVLEAELQTDDASEDATAPSERSTETEVPTASESEASSAAARGSNGAPGGGNIVETPTLQGSGGSSSQNITNPDPPLTGGAWPWGGTSQSAPDSWARQAAASADMAAQDTSMVAPPHSGGGGQVAMSVGVTQGAAAPAPHTGSTAGAQGQGAAAPLRGSGSGTQAAGTGRQTPTSQEGCKFLGHHLSLATKERIWRGEFLDFFELLNKEPDRKEGEKEDEKEKERRRRKKPARTWENWHPGFVIYAAVMVQAQPERAAALFHYWDIIYRAYNDFGGQAWIEYDESFRRMAAEQPELRWDEPLPRLWLQVMAPYAGDRTDTGHLLRRSTSAPRRSAGQVVQPRLVCWEYNSKGVCSRKQCRFRHECSVCGGPHSCSSCYRAGSFKQAGGRKPGGGNSNPGKGPHPN